ncbi:hypothetical protein P691DRAFT_192290 [Macrolepiota fuliginosa MF-IS2]|uniref:Cell wall protein n=1 Tax=Macrolepiota fuliginosa MF-IS2 TaxID=1400762 RepID=A0A9P5XNG3_9AGAR|nr:hypothetical protein P691DRAFT_192290 [Macrolepiota fuliginosa MF-IS2]
MQFRLSLLFFLSLCSLVWGLPIRREVPQEHSHEKFLTAVRTNLNLNNPDQIVDPVFALLGNAAATQGLGKITDPDCLQQAVADQAFTNAKQAGDVDGQVTALIFRALERNTGKVGLASAPCTSIKAVNPEIAAIQQHQDPASGNAASINKAITLELAKQIASVGGDPSEALNAGTFAPGDVNDPTAAGNTCDDANDPEGCIFTQKLIVFDATQDEVLAAAGGGSNSSNGTDTNSNAGSTNTGSGAPTTDGSVSGGSSNSSTSGSATGTQVPQTSDSGATGASPTPSQNLQTFTGALGGAAAPTVTVGGRGFVVEGSDDFLNAGAALGRSCDIQHNQCADIANSSTGRASGLTTGQCDQQNTACHAAAQN